MSSTGQKMPPSDQAETPEYEPPAVSVLGTLAELTQLGTALIDELLNDGSQE